MEIREIIEQMTLEEKALILTGTDSRVLNGVERLGVPTKEIIDGPQGVRVEKEDNATAFPAPVSIASSWNKETARRVGEALAADCIKQNCDMLLAPGINIKRFANCGRNFEYFSEDPIVAGVLSGEYIKGLESKGVGTSLKHYALNNQERNRLRTSVEVDLRTMNELYLKPFRIAIEKGKPTSIMCSYNKIHSIWAAENEYLLTKTLRDRFGYEGFVVSDWGAVHDICRSLEAGLDLQMPRNAEIASQIKKGLEEGRLSEETLDRAVENMLRFLLKPKAKDEGYNRDRQHEIARQAAEEGIVVLKNENVLPILPRKVKKIAVVGEYAVRPIFVGQGSVEVYPEDEYVSTPLEALKKAFGDEVEVEYHDFHIKMSELSEKMIWGQVGKWHRVAEESDAVIIFTGSLTAEDSEQYDRTSLYYRPEFNFVIEHIARHNPNTVVVSEAGGVMIPGDWLEDVGAYLHMWTAGEACGEAIANILTGKVNPSGKLTETFPKRPRTDIDNGDRYKVCYREGMDVGYRYYDKHPDEILYPFGFGLSYTRFEYSGFTVAEEDGRIIAEVDIKNAGEYDGAEAVQLYFAKEKSIVSRPIKELLGFEKVFVKKGETERVRIEVKTSELAYFNQMLDDFVVESGEYRFMIAASSQDIKDTKALYIEGDNRYTIDKETVASRA